MKTTLKRALAFLFAFVMVASLIPASILADESGETPVVNETLNVEAPAEAPAEEGTGGGYTEAPAEEAPAEEAPVEEPAEEAPVEEPAEAPAEEAPAEVPAEEVSAEVPAEEPVIAEQKVVIEPITPVETPEAIAPGEGGGIKIDKITRPPKSPTTGNKITFNGNGGKLNGIAAAEFTTTKTYEPGEKVKISTALEKKSFIHDLSADYSTNYRFVGWNTAKDGSGTMYQNSDTIVMPATALTLYAQWEEYEWIHWNIVLGEGGDYISYKKGTVPGFKAYCGNQGNSYGIVMVGEYCPVEAVAKENYKFIGWYYGEELITEGKLVHDTFRNVLPKLTMETSGAVLEARFEFLLKTITYTDGVEDEEIFADQVYYAEEGDPTPEFVGTPTRENWNFVGWSPEVSETVTGDATYAAQWEKATNNKPKTSQRIKASDINNRMQLRAHGLGTEDTGHYWSCSPQKITSLVDYTIGDVQGNDVDGYTTTITFRFKPGDAFEAAASKSFNTWETYSQWYPEWQGEWTYVFSEERPAEQSVTLYWVSSTNPLTGKLSGAWYIYHNGELAKLSNVNIQVAHVDLEIKRTITYTDGVEDEEVFADQTYTVRNGSATPAFEGTPTRKGYLFDGWKPAVAEKVYADATYEAQWVEAYTVTYTDGKNGEAFADEVHTVLPGTKTPEFTGTITPGWVLDGWTPAVADTVTGDVTYTAKLKTVAANTLRLNGNGGLKNGSATSDSYTGDLYAVLRSNGSEFVYPGHTFKSWNTEPDGSGTTYKKGDQIYFEYAHNGEIIVLYAQWEINQYTVTYTDGVENEEVFADQSYTVDFGTKTPAFKGTPTRENWNFLGWEPEVADTVTDDATYVAQWEKATKNKPANITEDKVKKMELRAVAKGSSEVNPNNEDYTCTPTCKTTGVTYTIGEVQGNDVDGYTTTVTFHFRTGDAFEAEAGEVFNTRSLAGTPEWNGKWTYSFSDARPADQTLTLYWKGVYNSSFKIWKYNWYIENAYAGGYTTNISSAVANIIKVDLVLNRTITYTDGVEGEEVFADQTYTVLNGSATPGFEGTPERTGYTFAGWEPVVAEKVYANATYEAQWERIPVTVTYKDGVNGEAFEDQVHNAHYGDAVPAFEGEPTRTGYKFGGWDVAEVPETLTEDLVFTAKWEICQFTVTYTDGVENEEVFADQSSTVDFGSKTPAFEGTPEREGYTFAGWEPAVAETVGAEDVTYTAKWEIIPVTVTYTDGVKGKAFKDQVFNASYGDAVPAFEGTPERKGYKFLGWDVEAPETLTGDITFTAKWGRINDSDVPNTGDDNRILRPAVLMGALLLLGAGAAMVVVSKRRKQES